jgi:hypothetical protein
MMGASSDEVRLCEPGLKACSAFAFGTATAISPPTAAVFCRCATSPSSATSGSASAASAALDLRLPTIARVDLPSGRAPLH